MTNRLPRLLAIVLILTPHPAPAGLPAANDPCEVQILAERWRATGAPHAASALARSLRTAAPDTAYELLRYAALHGDTAAQSAIGRRTAALAAHLPPEEASHKRILAAAWRTIAAATYAIPGLSDDEAVLARHFAERFALARPEAAAEMAHRWGPPERRAALIAPALAALHPNASCP